MRWLPWKIPSKEPPKASEHPYLQGRYAFERLFGDLARSRRQWQATALVAMVTCVVLATGFVMLTRVQKVVPYIVELDALGEVRVGNTLVAADPPERALMSALRRFVHNLRTVPSDARILNTQLGLAQVFVAGSAQTTFVKDVQVRRADLEKMLRRNETRYVEEVSSILKVPGEANVYRVAWREVLNEQTVSAYEGHFRVEVLPPESATILVDNPLGIYVTDYTWSQISQ